MTREEEAIKILKEDGCGYCTWQSINPYECENEECKVKEALEMAIQALSQEPKMTLDEAIIHAEEVADSKCDKCGEEHRQLAEWLKELKAYKEQEPCDDAISREDALMCLTGMFKLNKNYNPEELIALFSNRIKDLPSVNPQASEHLGM